jgi:hypothetical protein
MAIDVSLTDRSVYVKQIEGHGGLLFFAGQGRRRLPRLEITRASPTGGRE